MTDVRSAIVNNYSLAVLAVKLGLHKHLRALSPQLFEIINKFVKQQNTCQHFANPEHVRIEIILCEIAIGRELSASFESAPRNTEPE